MKNLVQYITEHQEFIDEYCDMLDQINFEIITESFGCKMLKELADQQTNLLDEWKDKKAAMQYSSFTKPLDISWVFKNSRVMWNKITDEDVKTFKGNDAEGLKLFKRICSNRSNSLTGIIILESTEREQNNVKYSGIILKEYYGVRYYSCIADNAKKDLKPTEALGYIYQDTTYHIVTFDGNTSLNGSERGTMQSDRTKSRSGMYVNNPGNEAELKKMADENRERYKKLAAKLKIERQAAADELPSKVDEAVDKVMKLAIEFAKNPGKYASFEYDISKLIELVSDKEVGYYDRGKYHRYGINGLMYYFSVYMKSKLSIAKGDSYSSDRSDFNKAKQKLEEVLDKIEKTYAEITKKVEEQKPVA